MTTSILRRRGVRGIRGQSLTEFALVVPILLLMVVGIMEFGRAWHMHQVVGDAARQGARTAAILNGSGIPEDSVVTVVMETLEAGGIRATPSMVLVGDPPPYDNFNGGTGLSVGVTVSVPYSFGVFAPVMRLACSSYGGGCNADQYNGVIQLKSSAVMRNE